MKCEGSGWTMHLGDCLEIMRGMPDRAFDAVVTDPPYGLGEARGKNKSRTRAGIPARDYGVSDWDDHPASPEQIAEMRRVSRWQVIFGGNYFVLPPSACWLVWDKLNSGDFADCELAWTNLKRAVRRIAWRWNGMIREGNEPRYHPTQKPVGVMLWTLGWLPEDEGATILDPFAGSGTTGVAAIRQGRRFVGIEREREHFDTACARLRAEESATTIEAAKVGQASLFGVERP